MDETTLFNVKPVRFFSFGPDSVWTDSASPNGSLSSSYKISLQIQNNETKLWRGSDRIFPGETWRLAYWEDSNPISYQNDRQDYEREELERMREKYSPKAINARNPWARSLGVVLFINILIAGYSLFQLFMRGCG